MFLLKSSPRITFCSNLSLVSCFVFKTPASSRFPPFPSGRQVQRLSGANFMLKACRTLEERAEQTDSRGDSAVSSLVRLSLREFFASRGREENIGRV